MDIIIAILLLSLIIFIHELGHYLAARFFKMPISEFAIGMGPELYSYYTGKTLYSIRAIPMGGYVNIEGMEIGSEVEDGFNSKSIFARFIVLFAGVFMNFFMAFIIVLSVIFYNGKINLDTRPIIGDVLVKSEAYKILKKNDRIIDINNIKIKDWNDIEKTVGLSLQKNNKLNIKIEREGKKDDVIVPLTYIKGMDKPIIGIVPKLIRQRYSLVNGIKESFIMYKKMFVDTLLGLKLLVTGEVKAKDISGPIGIVKIVGEASHNNRGMLVWLLAILSINVGMFNLLPFPALDGGRILFIIFEFLGIKVNKKIEERVHTAGMIVLFVLIIFVTGNDLLNIF